MIISSKLALLTAVVTGSPTQDHAFVGSKAGDERQVEGVKLSTTINVSACQVPDIPDLTASSAIRAIRGSSRSRDDIRYDRRTSQSSELLASWGGCDNLTLKGDSYMTIHLPHIFESSIVGAVRNGRYASLDDAMAEAASLLVQHLEQEKSKSKHALRLAVAISLGTVAWAFVIGFAIFGFSQQVTWHLLKERTEEILYFAYAFSVAGAITGVVAYAAAGKKRWAIGACATNVVLLAASLPIVHWLIRRKTAPSGDWAELLWGSARDCVAFGSVLGVCSAVIVSALVLASVVLERHTKRWQFGLIVAVIVALLGLWVVPVVAYGLPELAVPYVGLNHRHLYSTSLFAAGMTGAGSGSLAGAVVAGLMARWFNGKATGFHP